MYNVFFSYETYFYVIAKLYAIFIGLTALNPSF